MDLTKAFLIRKFGEYYRRAKLYEPKDFTKREWAFVPLEHFPQFVMHRHLAFEDPKELKAYILDRVPAHAYYSSAYYEDPSAEMDKKGWLGADLIFDIDADHIPKGTLKHAKFEVMKLVKILTTDFGVSEDDLEIVFSGRRGYHVHVYDERFRKLDSAERREIADYLTLTGLNVRRMGKMGMRILRCTNMGVEEERCISKLAVHIDPPVTADVKRLIRLPNSLHGKTGFVVRPVDLDELEEFDPLTDALAFGEEPVKVRVLRRVRLKVRGEEYRLSPGKHEVPEFVAILMMCGGVALYGH